MARATARADPWINEKAELISQSGFGSNYVITYPPVLRGLNTSVI
jgi:hypothetical protein